MSCDRFEASKSDEGRYRLLVDSISDYAIYMLDPEGRVTSWNSGAERIKGYAPAEIIGEHFSRFYSEDDQAAGVPAAALAEAARDGRFENEGWRIRKDGTAFWAHVILDPIRTSHGELVGYAKVTRDLTERKKSQEALRRSEEQFRMLVQGVSDHAIYMLDPEGRVNSWNFGAQRIKGYQSDEIIGEHFSRFYTDEDRAAEVPAQALQTAISKGHFEKEGWRVRKDGSRFWAHVVINPIRDETGEVIGFAKITRDITERLNAQRVLNEAREALLQTQKLDALGQLTGGIAHDFNNLLMVVLGNLELLRRHLPRDNPKAADLLGNAVKGAQRGTSLTKRMLTFARKQPLKLETVDLPGLVQGMAGLIQRSVGSSIEVTARLGGELLPVVTDPHQLESALLSLAVNARDAMPNGGKLTIEGAVRSVEAAQNVLAPGRYVVLRVIDQGEGMDKTTLDRAVEPFFTTKGASKGAGLGLSMVHGLATQAGGDLRIKSAPGEGTCIEIWLPTAAKPANAVSPLQPMPASAPGPRLVILAVDDDGLVLTNTTALLEDLGHQVIAATTATEAMVAAQHNRVDLVLTDFAMPFKNGLELAQAIRAIKPDMPIILASGYAELPSGPADNLLQLAKPYNQKELASAILAAMASHAPITARSARPLARPRRPNAH